MAVKTFDEYTAAPKAKSGRMVLYHGTKSAFDHFDRQFVNSGWGEQEYGYGFYFTDYYECAKEYSRNGVVMRVSVPTSKYLSYRSISRPDAMAIARKFFKYYTEENDYGRYAYPSDEARRDFWNEECKYLADCNDGGDVYGTIASLLGSNDETSEFLHSIGYVGIKFPASDGSTGKKFTNYVIFDEKDIEIIKD